MVEEGALTADAPPRGRLSVLWNAKERCGTPRNADTNGPQRLRQTLGAFYPGFFDENDYPKENFRKIMHIHVTDSIIKRYKEVKFVWVSARRHRMRCTRADATHACRPPATVQCLRHPLAHA